jgi:hypothetical protein
VGGIQHSGSGSLEKTSIDSPKQVGGNIQGKRVFIESTTGGIINLTKQNKSTNARGILGSSVVGTMPTGPTGNPTNPRTSLTFGQAGHSTLPAGPTGNDQPAAAPLENTEHYRTAHINKEMQSFLSEEFTT